MGLNYVESRGQRQLYAAFAELSGLFGKSLETQLSVRNDTYSDFGSTVNPKLAVRYQPVRALTLRSSVGTGFKAPTLQDAYGASLTGFVGPITDPIACKSVGNDQSNDLCQPRWFPGTLAANRNLKEETSLNYSFGVIVEPVRRLNFSLDYRKTKVDNVISSGDSQILADLIERGIDVSKYGASFDKDDNGFIQAVNMATFNLGTEEIDGLDFGANYTLKTRLGDFTFGTQHVYTINYFQQFYEEYGREQVVGREGRPRWRNFSRIGYEKGDYTLGLLARTTSRVEQYRRNTGHIEAITQYDASFQYKLSSNSTFQAGAINFLDTKPRADLSRGNRIDGRLYSSAITGYMTYRQAF